MLEIHNALGVSWEVVDPDYYRKILLKIYWDDQETPSVIAPLGDFFGLMNSLSGSYDSLPLSVSAKEPELHTFGGSAAFNSYFRMPFGKRARVVVENQNDIPYLQYFYIDYELSPDAAAGGHRLLPRALAPCAPQRRLGPGPPGQQHRDDHREPRRRRQLRRAGDGGPWPLRRLHPRGPALPGVLVGRGRRHDLHR